MKFYSKLYTSEGIDKDDCNYFGAFINRSISDNSNSQAKQKDRVINPVTKQGSVKCQRTQLVGDLEGQK